MAAHSIPNVKKRHILKARYFFSRFNVIDLWVGSGSAGAGCRGRLTAGRHSKCQKCLLSSGTLFFPSFLLSADSLPQTPSRRSCNVSLPGILRSEAFAGLRGWKLFLVGVENFSFLLSFFLNAAYRVAVQPKAPICCRTSTITRPDCSCILSLTHTYTHTH